MSGVQMSDFISKIGHLDPRFYSLIYCDTWGPDVGGPDVGGPDVGGPDVGGPDVRFPYKPSFYNSGGGGGGRYTSHNNIPILAVLQFMIIWVKSEKSNNCRRVYFCL